jgi:hypothetical protein
MNRIVSNHKAEVIITPGLASQITLLHNQCPPNTEWSGLLIYKITKGGVEDLKNLEIRAEHVYPMDFGDATFTSFEGNEEWLKCFEQYPQINPLTKDPNWFLGKIHSHHNMRAFHSGTDTADLYENAPKLPLFLSLVVNYSCIPFAEIAIVAEAEEKQVTASKWKLKNWPSVKDYSIKKEVKKVPTTFIIECTTVYEEEAWFVDQLAKLAKAKEKKYVQKVTYPNYPGHQFNQGREDKDYLGNPYKNMVTPHGLNTDSGWEKKSDAVSDRMYAKMIADISELITLDNGSALSPYQALVQTSTKLNVSDRENYKKAVKYYFCDAWYDTVFFNTNVTEVQAIELLQRFLNFHTQTYVYGPLNEALNELKTEYKVLREIQGSHMV